MKPVDTTITAIMVTGKTTARYPLAKLSVAAFTKQDYGGKRELLIVNDNPVPLYPPGEHPKFVRELQVTTHGKTLGELRNIGIANARNDYLVQWDDDDYSHEKRLTWQVEQTRKNTASIFTWETHCNLLTGQVFANCGRSQRSRGFPGTMMWPRRNKTMFPLLGKHEDTEFLLAMKKDITLLTLANKPNLYFRCYHGHNTWSEKHVMGKKRGARSLAVAEQDYVTKLLAGPYKAVVEKLRAEVS